VLSSLAASSQVDKEKALGGPGAPIEIEVYSSFDCPHCKVFHDQVLPLLVRDYVVPGKLFLVSREFPLSGQYHPYAREAANYATAAARIGKYAQVSEALFKSQETWAVNGKVWEAVATVLTAAEQKKVQEFAKAPDVLAEVQRDVDTATAGAVNQTPTLIITHGSKKYPVSGTPDYTLFKRFLDDLLAKRM
jgi:protein-disulfide isomerase